MSIATEIGRIKSATADIRSKYVELGIAESTDKIDDLAVAAGQIENKGAVSVTVAEGSTYTIPKGYHNGSGTVTGLPPAGDAVVETWETPDMTGPNSPSPYSAISDDEADGDHHIFWHAFDGDKSTSWSGKFYTKDNDDPDKMTISGVFNWGSPVTVKGVRIFHTGSSSTITGSLRIFYNDGDAFSNVSENAFSLDHTDTGTESVYMFDEPKTSDKFKFAITANIIDTSRAAYMLHIKEIEFLTEETITKYGLQSKTITPTTDQKNVTPDQGFYGLSSVTVNPIPTYYADVSTVSASVEDVLSGESFVDRDGELQYGEIANQGDISTEIDGITLDSVELDSGYYDEFTITLDDTIEQMLAEI